MMDLIYGNAERVCIWLGEANESSRTALRFIKNEVSHLQSFDTLCDSQDASKKWISLLDLMQRPWFSRRWVVQELALAQKAVIYCGHDRISWKKFAIAVELLVEVETATHRLSEVMKKDRQYQYIPSYFEFVSALGASLLVDANERLFRDDKETTLAEVSIHGKQDPDSDTESDKSLEASDSEDSNADNPPSSDTQKNGETKPRPRIQPLLSLEYLVSSLTIFDTSMPHNTIYALLAIAKDTTPRAVDPHVNGSSSRAHNGLNIYTQRKSYNVDYNLPYVDVCKEFIVFSIQRSAQADKSRALDVICRPWAIRESQLKKIREKKRQAKLKREKDDRRELDRAQRRESRLSGKVPTAMDSSSSTTNQGAQSSALSNAYARENPVGNVYPDDEDMPLPSWVPQLTGAPHAMTHKPGHAGPKMSRINADPLVGLPSLTQRNYSAAETKGVDMKSLRFRKRAKLGHFSMYVRGFVLDQIQEVEQVARNGGIPREWAELARWEITKGHPPDEFWRTLVANRGKDGKNPPVYYSRACEESFKKGGVESGAVDTSALIEYERNSVVAQFCRRVQAVTWNRALVKTESRKLGLVRKDVEKGDLVCILYGCSVPVIMRQSNRKEEEVVIRELEGELLHIKNTVVQSFKRYSMQKQRHKQQKGVGMKKLCKRWLDSTDWFRTNSFTKSQLTNEEIKEELLRILKKAMRDFDAWRFSERLKTWPEQLRKMDRERKEAEKVKIRPGKKQMDELLRKRKAQAQKAQDQEATRKRRKSRVGWEPGPVSVVNPTTDGIAHSASMSKGSSGSTKKKEYEQLIDWWSFEYELVVGRRWKKIVEERKKQREAFALKKFGEDWDLMQGKDYRAFEAKRREEGLWVERSMITNGEASSANTVAEERSDGQTQPASGATDTFVPSTPSGLSVKPSWKVPINKEELSQEEKDEYSQKIRKNLRDRLGEEGYFSYELLGECYIHGMMDGEAMLYQNEGDVNVIPSMVFEIR